ncbi:hypothetical protein NDU88_001520 [Pleurodeles waltl]|uniref:Uncharacterized protein n=1 Tax=Pleurodeles waltl TaxID=8319 RepID=A0AAV7VC52_PLEWA|nr:hypothetical protein NDU88_001520 [Pleurodeles waltl]
MRSKRLIGLYASPYESDEKEDDDKSDKSSGNKKKKKTYVDKEDLDVEDLIIQILRDRPPPYAAHDGGPSTSSAPTAPAQVMGTVEPVQTDNGQVQGVVQSTPNAVTTSVVQAQMHPQLIQRVYLDVPILEMTLNLVMLLEQVLLRPMLVQIEPTPMLLPQAQPQVLSKFTPMTGTQSDVTPVMNQTMGVALPQNAGVRRAPDAILLLITVGPEIPLFTQNKSNAGEQGEMSQNLVRRGVSDHVQVISTVGQNFDGSRPLMDLSPLVVLPDAVNGPSASQSLKLLTPQTPGAVVQQVPLPNASNISLQGLTAQQLSEWLDSLNPRRNASKGEEHINRVRIATEITEIVEGKMGVIRLKSYTEDELRYLCPRITREVSRIHQELADLVDKHDIEIERTKHLKRSYRLVFMAKDFEHMRSTGMKAHLKELLKSSQIWGALEKWEGRWAKKKDKWKQDSQEGSESVQKEKDPVKILQMREIPGRQFVHVPWHRSDILSFTNDYPKLREKPVEWYQQTDRFVKLSKCLWEDLNTVLGIVVPSDLWVECKRAVDWPTGEPERDRVTGAPSPEVINHFYKVIKFLKTRISPENIDWQKIDRTVQEVKESLHTYYERLLKAFKEYSGKEAIEPKDILHFVFSDEIELKQKKLKEKAMVMQIKAAQTGVQGALVQQMPQQKGNVMFQPKMRGIEVQTNSDDDEEQTSENANDNVNEEYPLTEFFPMFTVKELHADLQGTVQENVWDLTGKEVGLIK